LGLNNNHIIVGKESTLPGSSDERVLKHLIQQEILWMLAYPSS
jgi:hypothetical protein